MKPRVYVAGAGVISAIGTTLSENFASLRNGRAGIGVPWFLKTEHYHLPVGEVRLTNEQLAVRAGMPELTRTALLGSIAAQEAIAHSRIKNWSAYRTGFISATTVGGMDRTELFFADFLKDRSQGDLRDVQHHECGTTTELIAEKVGITGYVSTINTACSSSVNSIIFGTRLIQAGLLDIVVAGGTDSLTKFTLNGFNSLMILDKDLCRPFDASRNGLNLGEGAGYIVLVSEKIAEREKLNTRITVSGYANTNDAFHQTASSPEGRGSFDAMRLSLTMSGLAPSDIDYINLHGTGTINNDQSEGTAVGRLFADEVPDLSSTKSFTGHTLGACGGIEAVYSILAIEHSCIFPSLRFSDPMPEIGVTPTTQFKTKSQVRHVMSNSFGFGGNCSSIIFSKTI